MRLQSFVTGDFGHRFWRDRLTPALLGMFLGGLGVAWALRPVWLGPEWSYLPFTQVISNLGWGRHLGNPGAWVFAAVFVLFAVLGVVWGAWMFGQFARVSRPFAALFMLVLLVSLGGIACVGIFDGEWPSPSISRVVHVMGASLAFSGSTLMLVLVTIFLAVVDRRRTPEHRHRREMLTLSAMVSFLVLVFGVFLAIGTPFWQWSLMLSLMNALFWLSRTFPEDIREGCGLR